MVPLPAPGTSRAALSHAEEGLLGHLEMPCLFTPPKRTKAPVLLLPFLHLRGRSKTFRFAKQISLQIVTALSVWVPYAIWIIPHKRLLVVDPAARCAFVLLLGAPINVSPSGAVRVFCCIYVTSVCVAPPYCNDIKIKKRQSK